MNSLNANILCIGEALVDMICTDVNTPLAAGEHFLSKTGGAPTNVAAAIAALGGNVALAAKVGKDAFGDKLVGTMQDFGVDTSCMLRDEQRFTTLAFVSLMQNGERDFLFSRGADGELSTADIDRMDTSHPTIIHFGSATAFLPGPLQQAYVHLLEKAVNGKQFISFDPNYRHLLYRDVQESFITQSKAFLRQCHFTKLSEEEAMLITGKASLDEAASALRQITTAVFAITLGEQGTLLGHGDAVDIIPSVPVEARDTTGAGDAFVGAVLHELGRKDVHAISRMEANEWKLIIAHANAIAAETCRHFGAMEAFRMLRESR